MRMAKALTSIMFSAIISLGTAFAGFSVSAIGVSAEEIQTGGNAFDDTRMKLLLTQEALAKEPGVSYATICRWEKDNREPQIVSQGKFYAFCESKDIKFDE